MYLSSNPTPVGLGLPSWSLAPVHCNAFKLNYCADVGLSSTTFTYTTATSGFRQDGCIFRGHPGLVQLSDCCPIICSLKFTKCVRRLACDREHLFKVIVHLGNPGVRDFVRLLDITSVSLGIPGEMGTTFSSTCNPNHHESVDRSSAEFRCFRSTSLVHKSVLSYLFK